MTDRAMTLNTNNLITCKITINVCVLMFDSIYTLCNADVSTLLSLSCIGMISLSDVIATNTSGFSSRTEKLIYTNTSAFQMQVQFQNSKIPKS